jgi:hypothetical protein
MRFHIGFLLLQFLIAICLLSVVETQQTLQIKDRKRERKNESENYNNSNPALESKHTYQISSIEKPTALSFMGALSRARKKSFAGGYSGFVAGAIQVVTLMWLRTTVNYQYRYGVTMMEALRELNRQGGVQRFYRGLPYALIQGI